MEAEEIKRALEALSLIGQSESPDFSGLPETLDRIAKLGERRGSREVCLRAQSLRQLVGPASKPGQRVAELIHDLHFHLSHLEWIRGVGEERVSAPR